MKVLYYLFLAILLPFTAQASILTEKITKGKQGDYVIYQVDKWIHCLVLVEIQKNILKIEEITLPLNQRPKTSWKEWKEKKAPGHSAWYVYTIDIEKFKILSSFDMDTMHYISVDHLSSFILDLMALPLSPLPSSDRKKIGPEPNEGIMDTRSLWNPPCSMFGKKVEKPQYDVFSAKWKQDESELSGKIIDCYFLHQDPSFPFPLWIQIRDAADARFNLIEIDAGH